MSQTKEEQKLERRARDENSSLGKENDPTHRAQNYEGLDNRRKKSGRRRFKTDKGRGTEKKSRGRGRGEEGV